MDAKDIIRDPYVLEFLGLEQTPNLYEKDLEQGLIVFNALNPSEEILED